MQIDATVPHSGQSEADNVEFARKLSVMLAQINALQTLVREDDDGDSTGETAPDLPALRQGLSRLEQLAGAMLYELQVASGGLSLADLPGSLPLAEALSQLVETTAETLGLSSRVAFSGRERPLPDYLSRLLYRIALEALAQVSHHTGAHRLRFTLDYRRMELVMKIEDDGFSGGEEQFLGDQAGETATFPPFLVSDQEEDSTTLLALTMRRLRSMIESLGGVLDSSSAIEQGTQLQVHVPYRNNSVPLSNEEPQAAVALPEQAKLAPSGRTSVLVVDNQTVSRAGLRSLLEGYPDLEIVGEASDSVQAVSEAAELLPQIVLIDAQLPSNGSLETLRQLHQLNQEIHVLLLSSQEDEELLYEALRSGASGYVLKDIVPDELAQTIRIVARGEVLVQPQLAARLLTRSGGSGRNTVSAQESLTAREREVLQLLVRGLRNKEIAARLFVSERTVNFHLANIYAKLHVSGRTEALSRALEQGLIKV
jgi:DNA-binding NarL/FixJ family response regulator